MANINNEQRKNLARIVEQNGTYSDFYQMKYEVQDKALVASHKEDIANHAELFAEYEKVAKEGEKKIEEVKKADALAREKAQKAYRVIENKLSEAGLSYDRPYRYGGDDEVKGTWKANSGRFSSEYTRWQKELIASIWASDTVEKAKTFVDDFLKASNKKN